MERRDGGGMGWGGMDGMGWDGMEGKGSGEGNEPGTVVVRHPMCTALTNKMCSSTVNEPLLCISASSTCDPTTMPPRIHDFVSLVKPNCKATARRWDGILIVNSAAQVPKDILVHEG